MHVRATPAWAGKRPPLPGASRPILFIADLHLTPDRPKPVELFQRFLREIVPHAQALYILGDFFEAWVGDDDLALPFHADIAARLKQLAANGIPIYFMAGNRDFLAGTDLDKATGWTRLDDPVVIELFGQATLLSHGDAYCTDDRAYQAFRLQVRNPAWQTEFLQRPIDVRRDMAKALRERSEEAKTDKSSNIMDVNPIAIQAAMIQAGVTRMIHGHTHRPARHIVHLPETTGERWVLADWFEIGGYLSCAPTGCTAHLLT